MSRKDPHARKKQLKARKAREARKSAIKQRFLDDLDPATPIVVMHGERWQTLAEARAAHDMVNQASADAGHPVSPEESEQEWQELMQAPFVKQTTAGEWLAFLQGGK